jgi:hypothetical protein
MASPVKVRQKRSDLFLEKSAQKAHIVLGTFLKSAINN